MTFSTGSSCVVKMKRSEDEMSTMIAESREARKHLRELGMIRKTVAAHRLKELRHFHAVNKLAPWRRTNGFDRLEDGDDWVYGPLPPTPEQITASMWLDLNALEYAIWMSGKDGLRQRLKSFIKEIGQGTVSFTDEEFAILKRMVEERRGRDAVHGTVAPIDTALPCSPRSCSSEISFDVRVCMEINDEGRMDPERGQPEQSSAGTDQLESPSAGTGYETPGQQYLPYRGTGGITGGCLLVGGGSNLGGNNFSPQNPLSGREPVA